MNSTGPIQLIPLELWSKILSEDQGFTVGDFKILCFVSHFFKTICQPLAHRQLRVGTGEISYEYAQKRMGEKTVHLDRWKREMMGIVRAERRLRFIGGDDLLSAYPTIICIGAKSAPDSAPAGATAPPVVGMELSRAVYEAQLRFKRTLLRALPLFSQLRRVELSSFTVDERLLKLIGSQTALSELRFTACSFPSPTFPIPSIRSLEYVQIAKEEIPAALSLLSPPHLEVLHLEDTNSSTVLEAFRDRPTCTMLHRLTVVLGVYDSFDLISMGLLLSKVPGLRELDIHGYLAIAHERNSEDSTGPRTFKYSTIPSLRRFSGPLYFAKHIIPGRPINEVRIHHGDPCGSGVTWPLSTWPELQSFLQPLCSSSANAEAITALHLPRYQIADIRLLSRFVTETFPRLTSLLLPVLIVESSDQNDQFRVSFPPPWGCMLPLPQLCVPDTEGPFEDGGIDGLIQEIRHVVDYQLLGRFETPRYLSMDPAARIGRVQSDSSDSAIATAAMCVPKPDVARIIMELSDKVGLDGSGFPLAQPRDLQETLLYSYLRNDRPSLLKSSYLIFV